MRERACSKCGKVFEQNESDWVTQMARVAGRDDKNQMCYDCALGKITHGLAPEEGDFNAGKLISGEMSDADIEAMQEDMASIEEGRPIRESFGDDEEEYDDPAWCYDCNRDTAFCKCVCPHCSTHLDNCACNLYM